MASAAPEVVDVVHDEPQAHALYDRMVAAMGAADSLSYQSRHRWEAGGRKSAEGPTASG